MTCYDLYSSFIYVLRRSSSSHELMEVPISSWEMEHSGELTGAPGKSKGLSWLSCERLGDVTKLKVLHVPFYA